MSPLFAGFEGLSSLGTRITRDFQQSGTILMECTILKIVMIIGKIEEQLA